MKWVSSKISSPSLWAHARELWALFCELVCEKDQGPHGNLGVKSGLNLDFLQHNEPPRPTLT